MCGFCTLADIVDPCGKQGFGSIQMDLGTSELSIPDDTSTSETISIGETRDATLETVGDKDWFRIELTEGDAIQIDLFGLNHDRSNNLDALEDPYIRVRDASGNFLAENDDIVLGVQRDSRLVFLADTTGTYFIEVDSFLSDYTGDYRLQVTATSPPLPASPVDAIQTNFILNTEDPVLVYFADAGDTYAYNDATYVATGVNAYEQSQLFSVFEGVEEFIDVDFQITADRATADIEWATDTLPSTSEGTLLGFFFFPSSNGNGSYGVLNNNSDSFPSWNSAPGGTLDTGGFMYGVAVHELGHGLGLGHPHDNGGGSEVMQGVSSSSSRGNFGLNSAPFTALSYNEGWADDPAGVANKVASTGHGATFGALDIAALQNMYGKNTSHAAGNDVYELFDSNLKGSGAGYYATWDTGGTDEFRYSGTRDATIDLRDATLLYEEGGGGFMSHVSGVIAGRTIANGVLIENATGGSGDDELIGNDADNLLVGNAGDDQLTGGSGIDTFVFNFGDGFDSIADFELGTDLVDLRGLGLDFSDLVISQNGSTTNVQYDFTTGGQVSLTNVEATQLTASSFLLETTGSPQVLVEDQTVDKNEWVHFRDVFSTDGDGIGLYELFDNTGDNSWWADGRYVDASLGYQTADLSGIWFRGDSSAGQQTLRARVNDGDAWSAWEDFTVETVNTPPQALVEDQIVDKNEWVQLRDVLSTDDADGDGISLYELFDNTGGNSWWADGRYVDASLGYQTVGFSGIWFRGDTSAGQQTLSVRVNDGDDWSPSEDFIVETVNTPAQALVADQTVDQNEWIRLRDILSTDDADGDSIARYELFDNTGGNSWWADGGYRDATLGYETADLSGIWFRGDSSAGQQTLRVRVNDGDDWSAWEDFQLNTTPNDPPTVTVADQFLFVGESLNLADIVTVSDTNGDTITRYQVWDEIGADSFILDGVTLDASRGAYLADLDETKIQGDATPSAQPLWIRVYDGITWSEWDEFTLTTS